MRLLAGADLTEAIKRIASGEKVSCAVAFWGSGADGTIGAARERTVRIICNLDTGGTNPDAIIELMNAGAQVRQHDRLHAKVYIGDDEAIVTSANASTNGLGVEGKALAHWIETGVIIPAREAIAWFDALWVKSRAISNKDLTRARPRFAYHKTPGLNPTDIDFPIVAWSGTSDFTFNEKAIEKEVGEEYPFYQKIMDLGIELEVPSDATLFTEGRWVLRWNMKWDGFPDRRSAPWWTCTSGRIAKDGITLSNGTRRGFALPHLAPPPEPFSPGDRDFREAFYHVISTPGFSSLRDIEWDVGFYHPRLEAMRRFWHALRQEYNSRTA
jgi:hypothetical protein